MSEATDPLRPFYVGPAYEIRSLHRSSPPLQRGDSHQQVDSVDPPHSEQPRTFDVMRVYANRQPHRLPSPLDRGDERRKSGVSEAADPLRPFYVGPADKTRPARRSYLLPPNQRENSRQGSEVSPETDLSRPFYVRPAYEIRLPRSPSFQETGPFTIKSYRTTLDQLTHQAKDQGRQVEVVGNDNLFSTFHHRQGVNDFQDKGTCFATSTEMLLRQHDIKMNIGGEIRYLTENDLIRYCFHRLGYHPGSGMYFEKIRTLLDHVGIPNAWDAGCTEQDLAQLIKDKKSCLICVRSKDWFSSDPNAAFNAGHVVSVTAVVYNLSQHSRRTTIAGFIVCDTDEDNDGKEFVAPERLQRSWNNYGGCVIFSTRPYDSESQILEYRSSPGQIAR